MPKTVLHFVWINFLWLINHTLKVTNFPLSFFPTETLMWQWQCKECRTVVSSQSLKHYRLAHDHFVRSYPYLCAYPDFPFAFKTLNALRNHLSRLHANQNVQKSISLSSSNCLLCTCRDKTSVQEYFCHINNHL